MDLSHWNLVDSFTMWEAAYLAGGVDPKLSTVLSVEQKAKPSLIYQELAKAYDSAVWSAFFTLSGKRDPEETLYSAFRSGDLLSIELRQEALTCLRSRRDFNEQEFFAADNDSREKMRFSREGLNEWFVLKGFRPIYDFVSMPKVIESASVVAPVKENIDKPMTTSERNSLLAIIAALCDYSAIKHQERGAAIQIAKMTDEIGAPVSDDTVRRALAKIPDALESRMK